MQGEKLRNIGIIAHIDAGKTTFSERILYYAHVIHRMGEVHEGAATMDFLPEEQERGITIASACISCQWEGFRINLVDTPGHVDFTIEVERCLRVLDAAVGIFCAVAGVEPQSETVWAQADAFSIPRLAVINKMDRAGASFSRTLDAIAHRLKVRPLPLTIPVGEGEDFTALLDVVREERIDFDAATQGAKVLRQPLTSAEALLVAPYREQLLDVLTELNDALLEDVLSGNAIAPERLEQVIRVGVLQRHFVPVFAASALRNIGVQPVLDAVCKFLPDPHDIPAALALEDQAGAEPKQIEVPCDATAPFCALVFKVLVQAGHKIAFLRIYAGTLKEGDSVINTSAKGFMRVQKIYRLLADDKETLECAVAGDIVAVKGLKNIATGDTLTAKESLLHLEPIRSLRPVISLAFEAKNTEEGERLDEALAVIAAEDPTITVQADEGGGQRLVSGMGELHLDVVCERIKREFSLEPRVGNPQVVRHETVAIESAAEVEFDKEIGEQRQFGIVGLRVLPLARGAGTTVTLSESISGIPLEMLQAVRDSIAGCLSSGHHGLPVDDVAVMVEKIEKKEGKCTAVGLHLAAQQAFAKALDAGRAVVLEPQMQIVITVPDDFLGGVMSLLGVRGARVERLEDKGNGACIKDVYAVAPMQQLFGFATALRSATQGRAGVAMHFLCFDVASGK